LGTAIRSWAYVYIIDNSQIIQPKWTQGVPFFEKLLFPIVYPPMRSLVRKKYHVNAESAGQYYTQIESIFEKVSGLLVDGRNYLVGDKISAADITFASLAAPILQPPQHPIKSSDSQQLPTEMLSKIKNFQQTAAGKFALNLYNNWR
ncbi:MAG: glutathione S-transferase domain-containing protein, partial [Rivularia sp. (in: cyanobacteria)]